MLELPFCIIDLQILSWYRYHPNFVELSMKKYNNFFVNEDLKCLFLCMFCPIVFFTFLKTHSTHNARQVHSHFSFFIACKKKKIPTFWHNFSINGIHVNKITIMLRLLEIHVMSHIIDNNNIIMF